MKWIVKKETIFVQTVVCISFLPRSRRAQRWNYEAMKKYHCIVATEKGLPHPLHLTTTHTLFARRWKKNLLS